MIPAQIRDRVPGEILIPGIGLGAAVVVYSCTGVWQALLLPFALIYLRILVTDWKAAYWLLLAAIPFSVEFAASGSLSTSLPDEPLTWIFFLLLPLVLLHRPALLPRSALVSPVALILCLQLCWVVVTAFYSTDYLRSLKYLLVRSWLIAVFFMLPLLLFRHRRDFVVAFRALLIPIFVTACWVLIRHATYGFGFTRINDAIGPLYYNHVEYSSILSMIFPAACIAWPFVGQGKKFQKAAYALVLLMLTAAILLSYARAAILAVAFAGLVIAGIRFRFANWIMPVGYALTFLLAAYLIREKRYLDFRPNYEQTYMHHDLNTHLQATFQGRDMSSMERIYRWIAAIRMSSDKPLTGWGPNTFVLHYKAYTVPSFRTYVSSNKEQSTTHNYFLYLLAEQGWPGLLLYALSISIMLREAQLSYHRIRDRFYRGCILAAAGMFSAAIVNNCFSELTDTHKVGALFYFSIALIVVLSHKSRLQTSG